MSRGNTFQCRHKLRSEESPARVPQLNMKKQESQFISFIAQGLQIPGEPLNINGGLHTPMREGWVGRECTALKSFPKTWSKLMKSVRISMGEKSGNEPSHGATCPRTGAVGAPAFPWLL